MTLPIQLVVLAKRPVPGRVKTRLTPPYTPTEAALLAAASLRDTLAAVAATPVAARTLAFDQPPGRWLPPGFRDVRQRGDGLDARLEAAFLEAYAHRRLPVLLVGMDTPQLDSVLLAEAGRRLLDGATDAVLGPATDGGFWAAGLRRPRPGAFTGVPMSAPTTGREQARRFASLGLATVTLPRLTDVDDSATAHAVASAASATRFARRLAELDRRGERAA